MNDVKRPRRPYRSETRESSARETRERIRWAAAELFAEKGYAATSLADVAVVSGVARPTVFAAFGSKAELLRHVLDVTMAGDDDAVPVAERPWFQPVWDAGTQVEVLGAYAEVCTRIAERAGPVFELVHRAADEGADTAALWDAVQANRRAGAAMVVAHLRTRGPLQHSTARSVDLLWVHNDPALHASLVGSRGWSRTAFVRWLGTAMCSSLLVPSGRR